MFGKKVKLFFDDGDKISWREGKITFQDSFGVTLDNRQIIPHHRIVRMEVTE